MKIADLPANEKREISSTNSNALLEMPFDIYQRYKIVADIINKFRNANQKFRILDVGAGILETLEKFLPEDDIFSLDKDYPVEYTQKNNFIPGDILHIDLKEKYHFVVAIDVYEHIPPSNRKRFIDVIISLSEIGTIIATPFDQDEVTECEIIANEIYKTSHGSDNIWLKEHLEYGLPSLAHTKDMVEDYHLDYIIIPNGYLPRWFEMISLYMLTEGKLEFQPMMTTLYEFYNQNFYKYDNKNPAYRQTIIIQKSNIKFDFSDIIARTIEPAELCNKNSLLESFIEKIKRSYQISDVTYKQEIETKNRQLEERNAQIATQIKDLEHATATKDLQLDQMSTHIKNLEQTLATKDSQLDQMSTHIKNLKDKIAAKDSQIELLYQTVNAKKTEIASLYSTINQLKIDNDSIKESISYRLLTRYQKKIVEPLLPSTTRRRELYNLGLKGIRILFNEGFKKFIWHFKERRKVKRIEHGVLKSESEETVQSPIQNVTKITTAQLQFPTFPTGVEISIIIPVHNNFQFTENCLKSILQYTHINYEVVIVDDASTDVTADQLKNIPHLKVITNNENIGFIKSCNKGARSSNGKYLFFLNNDTLVTKDWSPTLLELLKRDDVGAVGSKLIYPDGRLQEAGALIWDDGSGHNYGRDDNPEKPEYNFVREVDYCSGAALLVKRELFEKIGGFDEQFIPAYYEDVDLCFSIRILGYKILYQPASVVIHFEGITSGKNLTDGVKQNQIINKEKFFRKWRVLLLKSHYRPNSSNLITARSRTSGKKILVIDQYVPFFDRDAGSYRMFNLLKILVELGHNVTFIGDNFNHYHPYDSILQQSGIEVIYSPFITSIEQYLSESGKIFEIVIVSRPNIAKKHIASIRKYCKNAIVIYDTVDLAFLRLSRMAEILNDSKLWVQADEMKKNELQLARISDITLVVSDNERQVLKREDHLLNVQVISLIHTVILPTKTFSERRDLLFLGAFLHKPNPDAALWFIKDIFPRIKTKQPGIRVYIVGDRPTKEILSLSSDDVIVTGYVQDLSEYFNNCRVFVAPLRFGAGVKGKINQSMSRGLPVVTTNIGAEGMGIIDGENVLIANNPELFSQKVIQLYNDEKLWNTISMNAIEHIQKNTSYEQSKIRIKQFIESL